LDEPTTGLDSYASESVVQTLSKLALQGRTIIFTIHQPSMEVLALFDRLLLLGRGRTVYFGTNAQMLDYFEGIGYPCPSWENPANFLMDTIHGDTHKHGNGDEDDGGNTDSTDDTEEVEGVGDSSNEDTEKKNGDEKDGTSNGVGDGLSGRYDKAQEQAIKLADFFSQSKLARHKVKRSPPPVPTHLHDNKPGFLQVLRTVVMRQFRHLWREPATLRAGIFQIIFVAVVMGLIYLRLGHTNTDLSDRTGAHFFAVVFMIFISILVPFFNFGTERKIFLFQYQDGLVSSSAFYAGKLVAEFPMFLVTATLWSVIFYWMVNFRGGAGHFFIYWITMVILINISFAYGMFIVNLIPNVQMALQVFPLFFMPLLIFSGFYLNKDNTPKYFIWVEYISFAKYAFQAIMNNEFTGVAYHCKGTEFRIVNGVSVCPYPSGTKWLDYFHVRDFPIYGDLLILLEMTLLYHLISYVLLRRAAKSESG
jgi:ABC-type multidrug transport system permease subunit